jgi:hypothetical protein
MGRCVMSVLPIIRRPEARLVQGVHVNGESYTLVCKPEQDPIALHYIGGARDVHLKGFELTDETTLTDIQEAILKAQKDANDELGAAAAGPWTAIVPVRCHIHPSIEVVYRSQVVMADGRMITVEAPSANLAWVLAHALVKSRGLL